MDGLEIGLNTRMKTLATMTSIENVYHTLQDIRLEATNFHNAQIRAMCVSNNTSTGCLDPNFPQQVLDSIQPLNSKLEDILAWSKTNTTPVDHSRMEKMEYQLQLLTEWVVKSQSSGSLSRENGHVTTPDAQETIKHHIQALVDLFRDGVNALFLKLWIILPVVQHIFRNLLAPRLLASLTTGDSIVFEDVLGRVVHLPYLHFRHHSVFIERLRCEFRGTPGENRVLMNQFRIFRQGRCNKFLTKDNWEVAVRPGSKIAMSVLLDSDDSESDKCPRCKTTKSNVGMKELLQWYVSEIMSKSMLITRSTACGLSWALQELDSPNISSHAASIQETTSDLQLARHMPWTEEHESSNPLASLPYPSSVWSYPADDQDIKSFRMIHLRTYDSVLKLTLLHH